MNEERWRTMRCLIAGDFHLPKTLSTALLTPEY
jgi:hypothetical protein